jgi:hypothetical protein
MLAVRPLHISRRTGNAKTDLNKAKTDLNETTVELQQLKISNKVCEGRVLGGVRLV